MKELKCLEAKELYLTNDEDIKKLKQRKNEFLDAYNSTKYEDKLTRVKLIREYFGHVGKNPNVYKPFHCDFCSHISIGDDFFMNVNCVILDGGKVTIGDNVFLGPNVHIYATTHPIDPLIRNEKLTLASDVTIGNNVWIGGGAIINPGVTIGNNVVVGSGSVVTKNIPDNVVAAGNPCKILRKIDENDSKFWEEMKNKREKFLANLEIDKT